MKKKKQETYQRLKMCHLKPLAFSFGAMEVMVVVVVMVIVAIICIVLVVAGCVKMVVQGCGDVSTCR